jgi:NAD(P)H-nitrite reductase large subunit
MVTHCICHDVSFETLLRLWREQGLDLEGLKRQTGCCTGCGTCEPYVRLVLRSGRTVLPVLSRAACDELMRSAPPRPAAEDLKETPAP